MFVLKLDVLLMHLQRAGAALVNYQKMRPPPVSDEDPREVQRMRNELRQAREDVRRRLTHRR